MAFNDVTDGIGETDSHSGKLTRDQARGAMIHFLHIATQETCHFKAFLTAFEDVYDSQWNETEVFGRMDPISTFKRTRRRIKLGWDVPSASPEEAILNLRETEKLLSMLYPVYEEFDARLNANVATTESKNVGRKVGVMVAPPLFKIKFANLIMDANGAIRGNVGEPKGEIQDAAATSGLVGTISGLSYRPDIEQGFFSSGEKLFVRDRVDIAEGSLIPQTISLDLEFVVHHTHGVGFSRTARERREARKNKNPPNGARRQPSLSWKRTKGFPHRADKVLRSRR